MKSFTTVFHGFTDLLDFMTDAAMAADPDGMVAYVNPAAAELLGLSQEEAAGRPLEEVLRLEEPEPAKPRLFLEGMGTRALLAAWDGRRIPIILRRAQAAPGGIGGTVVVFREEGAPLPREGGLAAILDSVPDIIYRLDERANFTYVSRAVERYGYVREELYGKSVFTLVHPEDREAVLYKVNERRTGDRRTSNVPFRLLARGAGADADRVRAGSRGEHPVMLLEAHGIYETHSRHGRVFLGTQGVARDISKRVWAEAALRESEQRYRSLVENTDIGVALMDRDHNILMVNRAMCAVYGIDAEDTAGRKCHEAFEQRTEPCRNCPGRLAMETGHAASREAWGQREDGTGFFARHKAFCVTDAGGECAGYTKFVEDMTVKVQAEEERARLQQQLQQAQKMEAIGTLAGGIAHDFNNILGVIMSCTELCMFQAGPGGRMARNLSQVLDAAQRAKALVQQILTFGRQKEVERKPVHVPSVVREATKLLRATLPSTIEIRTRLTTEPCTVLADPVQLHQVLLNLCSNAEHALEDGGTLHIGVDRVHLDPFDPMLGADAKPGSYVRLMVRDTGRGMSQEVRDRLFEPYFTTKPPDKGTGLGLSVVYGIVEAHGGIIQVESEPGRGSAFYLFFPVLEDAVAADETSGPPPAGSGEHVLLVDDESQLAEAAALILAGLGYRVTVASDAREALSRFEENPDGVDVVVTDQTMPRMTGKALAAELLRKRPGLPVVLCTGYGDVVTDEQARSMGLAGYLPKPYLMGDLARCVRRVLDDSRDGGAA